MVYYSTRTDLTNEDLVYESLENAAMWSTTPPEDLSTVTAIAVDCRKAADGSDFALAEARRLKVFVNMLAPHGKTLFAENASPRAVNEVMVDMTLSSDGVVRGERSRKSGSAIVTLNDSAFSFTKLRAEDTENGIAAGPLSGVGFSLYRMTGTPADEDALIDASDIDVNVWQAMDEEQFSAEDGKVEFEHIGVGEYRLIETTPRKNYVPAVNQWKVIMNADGTFDISSIDGDADGYDTLNVPFVYSEEDGWTLTNTYRPDPAPAMLTFTAGKKFINGSFADKTFTFTLSDGSGVIQTKQNDENGVVTFDEITFNAEGAYTFTVKESAADDGIIYDASDKTVTVNVAYVKETNRYVAVINGTEVSGDIDLGEFTNIKPVTLGVEATKRFTNGRLAADMFTFTLTGSVEDGAQVNQQKTNDGDGKISFDGFTFTKAGEYTLTMKEISGDDERMTYSDDEKEIKIVVTYDENENRFIVKANGIDCTYGTYDAGEFINSFISSGFEFTKTDGEKALAGAEFELANDDGVVQTAKSDKDGIVSFTDVPVGSYTLYEKSAPKGYVKSDAVVDVTVNINKSVDFKVADEDVNVDELFVNIPLKGTLIFTKTDGKNPLEGAVFVLTDASGEERIAASGADGSVLFDKLGEETYTLTERSAPDGYERFDREIKVEVRANGKVTCKYDNIVIEDMSALTANPQIERDFEFTKYASDGKALEGARFTLTGSDGVTRSTSSNVNGKVVFAGLPAGEYTLTEASAPECYKMSGATFTVRVGESVEVYDGSGKLANISQVEKAFVNTRTTEDTPKEEPEVVTGNVSFTKYSVTGVTLSGATFKLVENSTYKLEGGDTEYFATSGSDGVVSFKDIPAGRYILSETKAPDGYVVTDNTVEVKIGANGAASFRNSSNVAIATSAAETIMANYPETNWLGSSDETGSIIPTNSGTQSYTPSQSNSAPSSGTNGTVIYRSSNGDNTVVKTSDDNLGAVIAVVLSISALAAMAGMIVYRRRKRA